MAREKKPVYVSYDVYINITHDWRTYENWVKDYTMLSEEDVKYVACKIGNMKPARLQKLIDHQNRKFDCMRTKTIEVYKVFHEYPPVYVDQWAQTQERIAVLLAENRKSIDDAAAQRETLSVSQIPSKSKDGESS